MFFNKMMRWGLDIYIDSEITATVTKSHKSGFQWENHPFFFQGIEHSSKKVGLYFANNVMNESLCWLLTLALIISGPWLMCQNGEWVTVQQCARFETVSGIIGANCWCFITPFPVISYRTDWTMEHQNIKHWRQGGGSQWWWWLYLGCINCFEYDTQVTPLST